MTQCMGGFCRSREHCAHYWAPPDVRGGYVIVPPVDRLCPRGQEKPVPVPVRRVA